MPTPVERQRAGTDASGPKYSKEARRKKMKRGAAHAKFDGRKHVRVKGFKEGQKWRRRIPNPKKN